MDKGWAKDGKRVVVGWVKVGFVVSPIVSNAFFLMPITPSFSVCIFSPHIKGTKNAEINGLDRNFFDRNYFTTNKKQSARAKK